MSKRHPSVKVRKLRSGMWRLYITGVKGKTRVGVPGEEYSVMLRKGQACFMDLEDTRGGLRPPHRFLAIANTFCDAKHRRKGFSTKLHEEGVCFARSQGYHGIASDPDDRNMAADRFWKTMRGRGKSSRRRGWDVMMKCVRKGR